MATPRMESLDGLRAVAAIVVIGFHLDMIGMMGGYVGVDAFFVLSGFLITSLLVAEIDRTGRIDLARFYARRAVRLWPALLLLVCGYLLVWGVSAATATQGALAAFYLSDYSFAFWGVPDQLRHTWSLAVEQHFYLLWPLLLLALPGGRDRLRNVMLLGFVIATAWRVMDFQLFPDWNRTYHRFDTRMSGLFLGGALALTGWRPTVAQRKMIEIVALTVLMLAVAIDTWKHWVGLTFAITAAEIATAMLILAMRDGEGEAAKLFSRPVLVYLGTISYGIYLWHYLIFVTLRTQVPFQIGVPAVFFGSIALASLSYHLVERPLINRSRKLRQPVAAP